MLWIIVLIDALNGNFLFGYLSETEIVLLFGIILVALTIGIRWFLKKYEESGIKAERVAKEGERENAGRI